MATLKERLGIRWWEKLATVKERKIIVKLYRKEIFQESVIIPTVRFPLVNKMPMKHFSCENCEPIADKKLIDLIDSVEADTGRCHTNTARLVKLLLDNGYKAEHYVGWCFTSNDYPIVHSWCVIDEKYLVDFADTFDKLVQDYGEADDEKSDARDVIKEFHQTLKGLKNSEKHILGLPSKCMFYVGTCGTAQDGMTLYTNLYNQYQGRHPSCRQAPSTMSENQRYMTT